MFKKLMIIALILVVIGAVSVSVYNTTLAKAGQTEQQVSSSVPVLANTNLDLNGATNDLTSLDQQSSAAESDITAQLSVPQSPALNSGTAELSSLPAATPGELSDAEKAALEYMREEEKLAHDVYLALYELWGLTTFQNIANSEQAHTDSVKLLIDRYGLVDSAAAEPGKFNNPELQALYNTLIERGGQSLAEAIKVGGAIEEIDILDLQARLAQVDNADIQQVFNNLLRGSTSHLKAFVNALQNQAGEVYQPQYMTQEAYQAILSGAAGSGYGRSNGQGGGNGQGGNGQSGTGGGYRGGRP